MVRSSDLVPQAKKLEHEKSVEFSLLAAPMILEVVRSDYHCLKVTFEREYDRVINVFIFQFLAKIDPKILSQFCPSVILTLIRAVANVLNRDIWVEVKTRLLAQEEKNAKMQADREDRKATKFMALKRGVGGSKAFVPSKKSKHVKNAQPSHLLHSSASVSQNRSEATQLTEQELFEKFKNFLSTDSTVSQKREDKSSQEELFEKFKQSLAGAVPPAPHPHPTALPSQFKAATRSGGGQWRGKRTKVYATSHKVKMFKPQTKPSAPTVGGVHNLSKNFKLDVATATLLSKGHKFVPATKPSTDAKNLGFMSELRVNLYKKAFSIIIQMQGKIITLT